MNVKNMNFLEQFSNLVSELTYWWVNWLPIKGYKKPIEMADLGALPHKHQAKPIHDRFSKAYTEEKVWSVATVRVVILTHFHQSFIVGDSTGLGAQI